MTYRNHKPATSRRGGIAKLFLCGCLLPFMLIAVVAVGGGVYCWQYAKGMVASYTEETPMAIAKVDFTATESTQLSERVNTFSQRLASGEQAKTLVLSNREVNILLNSDPNLKDHVHVKLRDGNVYGEVSMPADIAPGGTGRFFNATVEFDIGMQNGELNLQLVDAIVKGEPLSQEVRDQMIGKNLADEAYKNPKAANLLSQLNSIEVRGDQLILTPKNGTGEALGNQITNVMYQGEPKQTQRQPVAPRSQPQTQFSRTQYQPSAPQPAATTSQARNTYTAPATPAQTNNTARPAQTGSSGRKAPEFIYLNQGSIQTNQFVK